MLRRLIIISLTGALLLPGQARKVAEEEVQRVHRSTLLIDTHNDVASDTLKGMDIGKSSPTNHTDVPRLRAGGVGAVFFAAYVASSYVKDNRAAHRVLEMIDTVRFDIVARYPDEFVLALSASDIEAAHKRGKIAALIGLEGGHAMEDSLRVLRDCYALGCRYMTLTHSDDNNWAGSSGVAPRNKGLTDFGREVIREMNRRNGTPLPHALHHCGRGAHLFPLIKKHFPLKSIDALTFPLNDVAKVRRDLTEEVWIMALIADSLVQAGPAGQIREAVREIMKARGRGRFALQLGDMLPGTPMEHRIALYEAVKEYGRY